MAPAVWRLVLLISCAHALVHMYELSLPSVEQEIAFEYFGDDLLAGKRATGLMSWCWRLPWGLGALGAGWLVDRFGSRRMLALYLTGCAAMCGLVALAQPLELLFVAMFAMGGFACIYHPAGLALISHATNQHSRPRALGLHGIFGSAGIAAAPFAAALVLGGGVGWRSYYWVLAAPGALLGIVFWLQARHDRAPTADREPQTADASAADEREREHVDWISFFSLTVLAVLQGFIYSGMMSFLPRYLGEWDANWSQSLGVSGPRYLASGVLLVGCVGQYLSGRFARADRLERQLTLITLANAPFLGWMAVATSYDRAIAAALFALVHFMHQPIYNSLIAKYTPPARRSLCYGFSFAMGLGVGSAGAAFAGFVADDLVTHGVLAGVALAGAGMGAVLWRRNRRPLA